MIIGPTFIWLHFPKCAGTTLEAVLRRHFGADSTIAFDDLDPSNVIWHHSIALRAQYDESFEPGNREIISCIRRLPAWLLSITHFNAWRAPQYKPTREMLTAGKFYEPNGKINKADDYAALFAASDVAQWLRTEHLEQDFVRCFSQHLDVGRIEPGELSTSTNDARFDYIRDTSFYFTAQELTDLYAANPIWATLEAEVYGSL